MLIQKSCYNDFCQPVELRIQLAPTLGLPRGSDNDDDDDDDDDDDIMMMRRRRQN